MSTPSGVYRLRPSWTPRYHRDLFVPADLALLTGPHRGRLDPPVNLFWQPGGIDFADPCDAGRFYVSALGHVNGRDELSDWINAKLLTACWRQLSLPAIVRAAWETIHPQLRAEHAAVADLQRVQDTVLTAIADSGFGLAGRSVLIDVDVVSVDTGAVDHRWDLPPFRAAADGMVATCRARDWHTEIALDHDTDIQVQVDTGNGHLVRVQLVHPASSPLPGGGVLVVVDDVVADKGSAIAEAAGGRGFFDLAQIMQIPRWNRGRVEDAMTAIGCAEQIPSFRQSLARFRAGEFDDRIARSGFDVAYCHRVLDDAH